MAFDGAGGEWSDWAGLRNLFFALRPDPDTADLISRRTAWLAGRAGLTSVPRPKEMLHVSLSGLGRYDELPVGIVARAMKAASMVQVRAFMVSFNLLGSFGKNGRRPLVMFGDDGVIGVFLLHSALHAALADAGMARRRERPFEPHVTLLYDQHEIPEQSIAPVSWRVNEFLLLEGFHGQGRHQVLGRWALSHD